MEKKTVATQETNMSEIFNLNPDQKVTPVKVQREIYVGNDKQERYSYFIKGTVKDKEVRVRIVPPDNGGYIVLDIVFDKEDSAHLISTPYEIVDERTGKVTTGETYSVMSVDLDGKVYDCPVRPFKASDKSLLGMILR